MADGDTKAIYDQLRHMDEEQVKRHLVIVDRIGKLEGAMHRAPCASLITFEARVDEERKTAAAERAASKRSWSQVLVETVLSPVIAAIIAAIVAVLAVKG